jgi:aspartyl-tRNA(Asn)/glutamyl-tRNA(Gln) amidotransferase subunit B
VHGLSAYDAQVLVQDKAVADYYDAVVATGKSDPKTIANWITGELFRHLNDKGLTIDDIAISPQNLAELIDLVSRNKINLKTGKSVLEEMLRTGSSARKIVEKRGLSQISDEGALLEIIRQVLDEHPDEVGQYLEGKEQIQGWLMGQVMKASRGKANPQVVRDLLRAQLEARK